MLIRHPLPRQRVALVAGGTSPFQPCATLSVLLLPGADICMLGVRLGRGGVPVFPWVALTPYMHVTNMAVRLKEPSPVGVVFAYRGY